MYNNSCNVLFKFNRQVVLSSVVILLAVLFVGTGLPQAELCVLRQCTTPLPSLSSAPVQALHPLLYKLAQEKPDQIVRVIVQKSSQDDQAEELVKHLKGEVLVELRMINAFTTELKASQLLLLAQSDNVRWISLDAALSKTDCAYCTKTGNLANTYVQSVGATKVWDMGLQGQNVGVAIVDSGVNFKTDFYTDMGVNRVIANVAFHGGTNASTFDSYSHGTHVAGIIGGNGRSSSGKYIGMAPLVNLINVKVNDDNSLGAGTASGLVQGLQWILDHKSEYNIRVVNISLNSTVAESYHMSPINAAVEILWLNGIVVVTSAGNHGTGALYPPANDPFVITVGAVDDKGTSPIVDDSVPSFSAYGITSDGIAKPDLVAPGKNIISLMGNFNSGLPLLYPDHIVYSQNEPYLRISGTSMSAPIVAGGVALLLQSEPDLTPDQVKYRLLATASKDWPGYQQDIAGAGYLDVFAAVHSNTTASANTGVPVSNLLTTGQDGVLSPSVSWNSVSWNSVSWNSVSWNSVSWNSVSWNSVSWNSDYWGETDSALPTSAPSTATPTLISTPVLPTPTATSSPTNTPVPATATPTATSTPALPTSTATSTSTATPVPAIATPSSNSTLVVGALYKLVSRLDGNVLSVAPTLPQGNGQRVILLPDQGAPYQQWKLVSAGNGYFYLESQQTGRVLDTYNDASISGGRLQIWQLWNGANQQWRFANSSTSGSINVISRSSGYYLDVLSTSGSTLPVVRKKVNVLKSQEWQLIPIGNSSSNTTSGYTGLGNTSTEGTNERVYLPLISSSN